MAAPSARSPREEKVEPLESVVIRFAGDSGDGMQLTGSQFTNTSALVGNDLATLPDYPAEIRAPAGTLGGVSGFQLNFSSNEIFTPGDDLDVLVAMNPAALKRNLGDVRKGGTLVVNSGAFVTKNLKMAGYEASPIDDGSLDGFRVIALDISGLTAEALKDSGLTPHEIDRCKNFFTLGLLYWMYSRPIEPTRQWIEAKFKGKEQLVGANTTALKAGHAYGETAEIFQDRYEVRSRDGIEPGTYVNLTGNRAIAMGLVAAAQKAGLRLFLGSYPITPASDLLHELSRLKDFGVYTFQAEDEIAAVASAIGASFGGSLGVTSTSGPGLALKTEAVGLAVMAELPLVVVVVQRGGPSTGLPTKTEQADLLQAMYGRNGEAPVAIVAAKSPADCFDAAMEAARIATRHMVPVLLMSDGYLANGAEPWRIPDEADLPEVTVDFRTDPEGYFPYLRDEKTLARPWVRPGTAGLEHRIGGLEKQDVTGGVSYDPENHQRMIHLRAEKVARIANDIPDAELQGDPEGDLLLVGWGSTYGAITAAVAHARAKGRKVSHLHLRHISPMPHNVGPTLAGFDKVLVPELNAGQLVRLLRDRFLVDAKGLDKVKGLPFKTAEITRAIDEALEASS